MNMSTISLETPAASGPAGPATASPAVIAPGDTGFADRLAQVFSLQPAGQDLAAGIPRLQTLALGPTLEVVTAPAGKPDGASLAEFAKAQGLDDEVVAWLFSDPAQGQGAALAPVGTPGIPGTPVMTAITPPVQAPQAAAAMASLAQAAPAAPPWAPAPAAGLPSEPAVNALALALAPAAPNWLSQMEAATRPAAGLVTPDAQAEPVITIPGLHPAAGFMATALASRAGAGDPARVPATAVADMPVEVLALAVEPELQALWDEPSATELPLDPSSPADDRPLPTAAGTASPGQNAPDDAPVSSTSGARAEGYEALSQRVGEALAQRVLSQIERGQWQVRLLLKPAKLGEVEIDLKMHGGELDASFRAANPVTRDLLNDGLSRLREVLTDSGMEIADLNVTSGKSQQHGGNPTPRQPAASAASGGAGEPEMTAPSAASTQAARRSPGSDWDVLV